MKKNKPLKIFIGPHEIAGYYANLSDGLRMLKIDCDYITYHSHSFGYGGETRRPFLLKLVNWLIERRGDKERSTFMKVLFAVPREFIVTLWSVVAIFKYDVFIFGFGRTLMQGNIDLPLLRWLNKIVILNIAHGSDARPPYIDGAYQSMRGKQVDISKLVELSKKKEKFVTFLCKYASVIIGSPYSTSQFCKGKFLNSFAIGLPININHYISAPSDYQSTLDFKGFGRVRILHSPSHPMAKGSPIIVGAIDNLKNKGYQIDFVMIHGQPYSEVLAEIHRCDFVVDQIYSDTPMAGFATEAAWFAKPAVVGGYGLDNLRAFVPEGMWPPSQLCHPEKIEQAIEYLIINKEVRESIGRSAQAFVRKQWSAEEVARRYVRIIQGDIPEEWFLNPNNIYYLEGACQSVKRTKENICELVEKYGSKSLQLSHRPDLEKAFLKFAGINKSQSKNASYVP